MLAKVRYSAADERMMEISFFFFLLMLAFQSFVVWVGFVEGLEDFGVAGG